MLHKNPNLHQPVLLDEVLKLLDPKDGESYLDLTAGYGGHAERILEKTQAPTQAVLVDRDQQSIDHLEQQFKAKNVRIIKKDYYHASQELLGENEQFNVILADLGVSSPHLDTASRGFSIRLDGPLDMRMDQSQQLTAEAIVNNYSETELAEVIKAYGEEPKAKKIARKIVEHRPIQTTNELANLIARAWPGPTRRIHPATKVFQALRMEVNDELGQLEKALPIWLSLLAPGGRIAVISFHSLEDRIVKQCFRDQAGERYDATLRLLTRQPVTASTTELFTNPRARSAKLRAAAKIKTK